MSSLVCRRAGAGHRSELLRFWKKAYSDSFPYLKLRHPLESMDVFYDAMIEKGNEFHVADDGSMVGMCAVLAGHIQYVYVKADRQRQGIGTALLNHIFRSYPSQLFYLYVYKRNPEAVRLYEKLGFRIVGDHISKFEKEPSFRMERAGKHYPENELRGARRAQPKGSCLDSRKS